MPHVRKVPKKLILISAVMLVLLAAIFYSVYILNLDTIYQGISIDGHNISGMTLSEARLLSEEKIKNKYDEQEIILNYKSNSWKLGMKDISLTLSSEQALKNAFALGRTGNIIKRLQQIASIKLSNIDMQPVLSYRTEKIKELLESIKRQIDTEGKNASLYLKNGKVVIDREIIGQNVVIDKNLQLVENRIIENKFGNMDLFVEEVVPKITYNNIKEIDGVIASFKTSFNPQDVNRNHNIKLGCERINKTILMPNDIFSMNEVLGPRTTENGYLEAPVIFKNELVPGTGGGVCQITSTLYNAVLLSKSEVIERTHHSWPLGYVEPGHDATIAEDYIDFKFQNTLGYPVAISTDVTANTLYVRILGKTADRNFKVKLKNEILDVYEPQGEEIVYDETVPVNEKQVVREAKKGLKVVLYRETYSNSGELLEKEKISEDVYKPLQAQVKINPNYKAGS